MAYNTSGNWYYTFMREGYTDAPLSFQCLLKIAWYGCGRASCDLDGLR